MEYSLKKGFIKSKARLLSFGLVDNMTLISCFPLLVKALLFWRLEEENAMLP